MKHLLTLFALCIAMFVCASAAIGQKSDAPEAPNAIITSDSTCSFSSKDFPAFTSEDGVLNIPTHITKNGNTYTVTAIEYVASDSYSSIADSAYYEYEDSYIADTAYYEYEDSCIADTAYYEYEDSCPADSPYYEYEEYDPRKNIKVVNIPNTVTTIGESAFSSCSALTSINIPSSVTTICNCAFYDCKALTSINIPSSVTSIDDYAFSGCESLPVDNGVRYAGNCAVEVVDKSRSTYTIKPGTRFIDSDAFRGCEALTSINIPSSVTAIGNSAFQYHISLKSINVASDNQVYCSADGVLFSKDMKILLVYPKGKKGRYNIPEGVSTIGESAFSGCETLTSIDIPNGVTTIGESAFSSCSAFTSINIPNGVTTIGESAFSSCSALTSISIPSSVTSIGKFAFDWCRALTNIDVAHDNPAYSSVDGVLFSKDMKTLLVCPEGQKGHYSIPEGVTTIGDFAFYDCKKITSITLPSSLTTIGAYVFTLTAGWHMPLYNITTINCYSKTPPVCDDDENDIDGPGIYIGQTIHVPRGCAEAYRAAKYWQDCRIVDDL